MGTHRQMRPRTPHIAIAALACVLAAITPLGAGAFWPVNAGERVWSSRHVVFVADAASWLPLASGEWVVQPWLSALVQYGAWSVAGISGLSVVAVLGAGAAALALLATCRQRAGMSAATAASAAVLALWAPIPLRPELFALLPAALLLRELGRSGTNCGSLRAWGAAPLLVAVWSNLHGSFPIAVALCVAAAFGMVRGSFVTGMSYAQRCVWCVICACATLATPLGLMGWKYALRVSGSAVIPGVTPLWRPLDFSSMEGLLLAAMCAVIACGAVLATRGVSGWRAVSLEVLPIVPVMVLALATLDAQRYVVWCALVAAPELAVAIQRCTTAWSARARHRSAGTRHELHARGLRSAFLQIVTAALVVAAVVLTPGGSVQRSFAERALPADVLVAQITPADRVLAVAEWADYIRLQRGAEVAVDARLERFRPQDLDAYQQVTRTATCPSNTWCEGSWTVALLRDGSASVLARRLEQAGCMVEQSGQGRLRGSVFRAPCAGAVHGTKVEAL
jgi:hypothetical protein